MGDKHFDQMYADALEYDCRAMVLMLHLVDAKPRETGRRDDYWHHYTADHIMEHARNLLLLEDDFNDDMKVLLLDRAVTVHGHTQDGKFVKINDPHVMDYDDPRMGPDDFFAAMMALPDELCSGEQNE